MLDGRELRVQMARYGRPTSPQTRRGRDGGGRRDNGRRGGRYRGGSRDRERRRSRSYSRGRRSASRSRSRSVSKFCRHIDLYASFLIHMGLMIHLFN